MKRVRLIQAGLILVLVMAGLVGWMRIRRTGVSDTIAWIPADQVNYELRAERDSQAPPDSASVPAPAKTETEQPKTIECVLTQAAECPPCEPAATPPPEQKVEVVWPEAGPRLIQALAETPAKEMESFLGYSANDLVLGRIFDNSASRQKGEMMAIGRLVDFISKKIRPRSAADAARAAFVEGDLTKWWRPSAEDTLNKGIEAMNGLADEIKTGRAKMPGDPDTANELFALCTELLETEQKALTDPESAEGADDRFYHAQGVAIVTGQAVSGSVESFPRLMGSDKVRSGIKDALHWLEVAANMDPLIVLGGDADELSSNHLIIMAYALERAEDDLKGVTEEIGKIDQ